jgi:DNA-directed RNA polymerase specialized sigma24 family protein
MDDRAWSEFLENYAGLIYQVAGLFERDTDHAADCFLFVCEQLSANQFRRLRAFRADGPAKFTTWLRAVVRNLCLDWHRKEYGRQRIFQSIARLPAAEQDVYRCVYERGMTREEARLTLRTRYPALDLDAACARIEQNLTPRQLWLLSVQRPQRREAPDPVEDLAIPDGAPGPETLAVRGQQQARLTRALSGLADQERLLIRLRFDEDLTLQQVAGVLGLPDPQTADRRIREVLAKLKKHLE